MSGELRAFRAADQLAAILEAADLPPRVRTVGERVLARLSRPVRVAVLGRPGSGKRRLVNGLLGGDVLPDIEGLPPCEIAHGGGATLHAVDANGRSAEIARTLLAEINPYDLAFLRVHAPLPMLEKVSFILVPLEGRGPEIAAARAWACGRADMILWCTEQLGGRDDDLWPDLPEALQDHSFLAVTGADPGAHARGPASQSGRPAPSANRAYAESFFREVRNLAPGPGGATRIGGLRSALLSHVSMALREDLEGALLFLDQYVSHDMYPPQTGRSARTPTRPLDAPRHVVALPVEGARRPSRALSVPSIARPTLVGEPASAIEDAGPRTALPSQSGGHGPGRTVAEALAPAKPTVAAEIVDLIARRAEAFLPLCSEQGAPADASARAVLEGCSETLEACTGLADAEGGPLADMLAEATDLILLMRLEASQAAMADSLALMLQVRRECELALCA